MSTRVYYGVIGNRLKYVLLAISDQNKIQTCMNQKEYQLAHVPKKIRRWTSFLRDSTQSLEQCHLENISSRCVVTLTFFVLILFLSNSS